MRYSGRKSWPHCEMQCASSTATSVGGRRASISGKPGHLQALGSDEEKIEPSVEIGAACRARRVATPARVDALRREPVARELRDLVFHQRDERADDERRAAARQAREAGSRGTSPPPWASRGARRARASPPGTPLPGTACTTRSRTSRAAMTRDRPARPARLMGPCGGRPRLARPRAPSPSGAAPRRERSRRPLARSPRSPP